MIPLFLFLTCEPPAARCADSLDAKAADSVTIVAFAADSPEAVPPGADHFARFRIDSTTLAEILTSWSPVSPEAWGHHYSHVAFGDRTGSALLAPGGWVRWLVRPGGLAFLTFSDGRRVFLVSCPMPGD